MLGVSRGTRRGATRKYIVAGVPTTYALDSTFSTGLPTYREIRTTATGAGADVVAAAPIPASTAQLVAQWTTDPAVAGTQTIAGTVSFTLWGSWVQGAALASAAPGLRMELYRRASGGTETLLATFDNPSALTTTWAARTWGGTLPSTAIAEDGRLLFRLYLIRFSGNVMGGDWVSMSGGIGQGASVTLPQAVNVKLVLSGDVLFNSGFEGSLSIGSLYSHSMGQHRDITGTDSVTGQQWPGTLWGGAKIFHLSESGGDLLASLVDVTGRLGTASRALRLQTIGPGGGAHQCDLIWYPSPADNVQQYYMSVWLRLPANLQTVLSIGGFQPIGIEWKSNGDFRVDVNILRLGDGNLRWDMKWDNNANGGLPFQEFYRTTNNSAVVPVGVWFQAELFTIRGGPGVGRALFKVNGAVIDDHTGNTIGVNDAPINRIFGPIAYGSAAAHIECDEIIIRSTMPA